MMKKGAKKPISPCRSWGTKRSRSRSLSKDWLTDLRSSILPLYRWTTLYICTFEVPHHVNLMFKLLREKVKRRCCDQQMESVGQNSRKWSYPAPRNVRQASSRISGLCRWWMVPRLCRSRPVLGPSQALEKSSKNMQCLSDIVTITLWQNRPK